MAETQQSQKGFAEVNGTKLYYEVAGEGRVLVLNHGGLVDNHLWDASFYEFAKYFKTIRYDIRGFGQSALVTKETAPYTLEQDLYHLLQFLGIEKATVLGLSLGGTLAIDFTVQHPEMVEALITVGAGLSGFDFGTPPPELVAKFAAMEELFKKGDMAGAVEVSLQIWTDGPSRTPAQVDPAAREQVRVMTARNFARGNDEEVKPQEIDPPAFGRLSEIRVPMLIIVGELDDPMIVKIADALEQGIAGAKRAMIPGAAHHPNAEKPEEFNRIVIDFVKNLA